LGKTCEIAVYYREEENRGEKLDEKRYILRDAAKKLSVSVSTLYKWLVRDGLRETVEQQVDEVDRRSHYLTKDQFDKLAENHRRLAPSETPTAPKEPVEPNPWVELGPPSEIYSVDFWKRLSSAAHLLGNYPPGGYPPGSFADVWAKDRIRDIVEHVLGSEQLKELIAQLIKEELDKG
jgi:DNA-binding MarR family transcriptional regulator